MFSAPFRNLLLAAALVWGATFWCETQKVYSSASFSGAESSVADQSFRREVFEVLDQMVTYEHYYRSVYGRFTPVLGQIGYRIPASVGSRYEFRVTHASSDRLRIVALLDGGPEEMAANENYEARSIYPVPVPRAEYLQAVALRQLRAFVRAHDSGSAPAEHEERTLFKGFFRYGVRPSEKIAYAIGLRPPVLGIHLEESIGADPSRIPLASDDGAMISMGQRTGQERSLRQITSMSEESLLAQRIFEGEMGRPARSLSELARIANFRLGGAKLDSHESGDLIDIELSARAPASKGAEAKPHPEAEPRSEAEPEESDSSRALQIEPIVPAE